jgi:hypothetical protein
MKVERTDDIVGDIFRRLLSVLPDNNSPMDVSERKEKVSFSSSHLETLLEGSMRVAAEVEGILTWCLYLGSYVTPPEKSLADKADKITALRQ